MMMAKENMQHAATNLNLGKNEIYLGRWNYKNTEKYMDWANYDNCFKSGFELKKTKNL